MNIFSVLSEGNSRLHEVSMSAILAYFLDPQKDHGLHKTFLEAFLRLTQRPEISLCDFSNVTVELEKPLPNRRYIDIDVVISMGENKEHRFIIENKIRPQAGKKEQLSEYYKAYCDEISPRNIQERNVKITVVFITPAGESETLQDEFDDLTLESGDMKIRLRWQGKGNEGSIQEIIRNKILRKESVGKISPINEYVKHTLKAFAMHLETMPEVSNALKKRKKKSYKSDVVIMASSGDEKILRVSGYEIIQQQGWKYYVRKNGEKVVAKTALKQIIEEENLGNIIKLEEKGGELTTYQLGAAVWKELIAHDKSDS